jgi:hypothetical protein
MIDISGASWEKCQLHPLLPTEEVRAGALFIFDGMTKEILVKTPVLQYVNMKNNELTIIFSSYDATLMEGLKMITGSTFVIVRTESRKGTVTEQGYLILDVMWFRKEKGKEISARFKVRPGTPD